MPDALPSLHATALGASLTVGDLEASMAWYRDVVGFGVDQRHEREGSLVAVLLRASNIRVLKRRAAAGKPKKAARVACGRRLLVLCDAVVRDGQRRKASYSLVA